MAARHILRALPAGPLRLALPSRLALAIPVAARQSYSTATTTTTTTAAPTSAPSVPAPSTQSTQPATPAAQPAKQRGPFHVSRTPSDKLPVYESGERETRPETLVRKIDGDAHALKELLMAQLQLDSRKISVRPTTNHIKIKAHVKGKVIGILKELGY